MAENRRVSMLMLHGGTPRDQQARDELAQALPGAEVGPADEIGVFDVSLEADSFDDALIKVWDGVAASGTDDHLLFLEHPDLPEHWQERSGRPAGG